MGKATVGCDTLDRPHEDGGDRGVDVTLVRFPSLGFDLRISSPRGKGIFADGAPDGDVQSARGDGR